MNQKQIEEIDGMDPQQHQEEERIFMIYNLRGKLSENACSTAQHSRAAAAAADGRAASTAGSLGRLEYVT